MYYFTNNLTKSIAYLQTIEIQFISLFAQLVFAKGCKSFLKQMEYSSLMNILLYLWMEFLYFLKKENVYKYICVYLEIRRKDSFTFIYFI